MGGGRWRQAAAWDELVLSQVSRARRGPSGYSPIIEPLLNLVPPENEAPSIDEYPISHCAEFSEGLWATLRDRPVPIAKSIASYTCENRICEGPAPAVADDVKLFADVDWDSMVEDHG
jgi:hypothetical protein